MKKSALMMSLTSVLFISACNTSTSEPQQQATNTGTESPVLQSNKVATVNGVDISEHTLTAYMQQRLAQVPEADTPSARRQILEEAINMELAIQDAVKLNLDKDPYVSIELETQRRNILASAAFGKYLKENPKTETDLKKLYEENIKPASFQDFKVRHILSETEAEAKAIIAKLKTGADFIETAKTDSKGPSAEKGGDLGWLNSQDILPEILDVIQKLDKNEYTENPVKTQFGWHVVKLDDIKQTPVPTYEKLKSELTTIAQRQTLEDYLNSLRDKANIVIHDEFAKANAELKSQVEGAAK